MSNYLGFDISQWQGKPPRQWFRDLRAAGFQCGIIQLWGGGPNGKGPNPHATYQLQMTREEGMDIMGYIWVPSGGVDTSALIQSAVSAAGSDYANLLYVWPDVEAQFVGAARLQNCLDNIHATGKPTGIYINRGSFPLIGGSFPQEKLWDAAWFYNSGTLPSRGEWPAEPGNASYGGWTERAIRQFAGDVNLFGGKLDLNIVSYSRLGITPGQVPSQPPVAPIPNPSPEEMTMGQYEDLVTRIDAIAGALNTHAAGPHNQGAPAPQPVPVPPPAAQNTYTVQAGDTLGAIAARFTGNASRWTEIPNLPADVRADPRKLQAGMVLVIPWGGAAPAPTPAPAPAQRTYTVRSGDTLSGIAASQLSNTGRWQEIANLNGIADPNRIQVGQVLKLPA